MFAATSPCSDSTLSLQVGAPLYNIAGGLVRQRVETNMDSDIDKFSRSASIASETVAAIRTVSSLALEDDDVLRRYAAELDTAFKQSTAPLFYMMIWDVFM